MRNRYQDSGLLLQNSPIIASQSINIPLSQRIGIKLSGQGNCRFSSNLLLPATSIQIFIDLLIIIMMVFMNCTKYCSITTKNDSRTSWLCPPPAQRAFQAVRPFKSTAQTAHIGGGAEGASQQFLALSIPVGGVASTPGLKPSPGSSLIPVFLLEPSVDLTQGWSVK